MTELRNNLSSGKRAGMVIHSKDTAVLKKQMTATAFKELGLEEKKKVEKARDELAKKNTLGVNECHTCKYRVAGKTRRWDCIENINDAPMENVWERRCVGWVKL